MTRACGAWGQTSGTQTTRITAHVLFTECPGHMMTVAVGPADLTWQWLKSTGLATVTETVAVPGVQWCPVRCGKDCRVNTDFPDADDEFRVVADATFGLVTVSRVGTSDGWDMDLQLPCCASGIVFALPFVL